MSPGAFTQIKPLSDSLPSGLMGTSTSPFWPHPLATAPDSSMGIYI